MNELEDFLRNAAKLMPAREPAPDSQPKQRPTAPADVPTQRTVDTFPSKPPLPASLAGSALDLLMQPGGLEHAVLMSEILRRPVERWERNW